MTEDKYLRARKDLEFFPMQHGNEQLILIKDPLGLVEEGKSLPLDLYGIMALLDGTKSARDVQVALMRQKGGLLVGIDEVERLIDHLDDSFLLDTERYHRAREQVVANFSSSQIRPCSYCGRSYPDKGSELRHRLDEILESQPLVPKPEEKLTALIAPHIDLSVGASVYGSAYQHLKHASPSRVVVLGVGHHMMEDLFCLTEKDFQTPLGEVKNDRSTVKKLQQVGRKIVSDNDFVHKAEHSVEFQVIFLQHILAQDSFSIIPILCGPLKESLSEYTRDAYLEMASPFLSALSELLREKNEETLIVAGVDFSHIGPKFGHDMPASYLEGQSRKHDQKLLDALSQGETESFWEESKSQKDRFNVCGFSAMACLLEVLPPSTGQILNYQIWHERPTRSAVSFAAVVFSST